MNPSTLRGLIEAYTIPEGIDRETEINAKIDEKDNRSQLTVWFQAHPTLTEKSPILRDLNKRLKYVPVIPPRVNASGNSTSLMMTAVQYIRSALNALDLSDEIEAPEDKCNISSLETLLISKDKAKLNQLKDYFSKNPEELFKNADLIKAHLELTTLSFPEFILILGAAAENLDDIEHLIPAYPSIDSEFEKRPSLCRVFQNELKHCISLGELDSLIPHFVVLLEQDKRSAEPMLVEALVQILTTKDKNGESLLHVPEIQAVVLPALLEKLSTKNLINLLNDKTVFITTLRHVGLDLLPKPQLLRLCAVLVKMSLASGNDTRAFIVEFNKKLPKFAQSFNEELLFRFIPGKYPQGGSYQGPDSNIVIWNRTYSGLSQEEQDVVIADYIETYDVPLKNMELREDDLLRLGPRLRYVDLRNFTDYSFANKLLRTCSKLTHLFINNGEMIDGIKELPCQVFVCSNSSLTSLPELPQCEELDCRNNFHLSHLSALPRIKKLNIQGCPKLQQR